MTVAKLRCCDKCDAPRTYRQFMQNHTTTPKLPAPEEEEERDICAICRLPYGSENLSLMMLDSRLAVTNLAGCKHIFGAACVKWLSRDSCTALHQRCPLCRTEWWHEKDPTDPDTDDQTKHTMSEQLARHWETDYSTARYFMYREQEYRHVYPPLERVALLASLKMRQAIGTAVMTDAIQLRLRKLQEKYVLTIAELAYDPMEVSLEHLMYDPFTFNNYYLSASCMRSAIYQTLTSMRGERLWQMYRDMVRGTQAGHEEYSLGAIERVWMQMFPGDEGDWVRFLLQVLEVAYPVVKADEDARMYENDEEEGLDQAYDTWD